MSPDQFDRLSRYFVAGLYHVGIPVSGVSWVRSAGRNREVGGLANSFHLFGLAHDFVTDEPMTDRERAFVRAWGSRLGFDTVIHTPREVHIEPTGPSFPFPP